MICKNEVPVEEDLEALGREAKGAKPTANHTRFERRSTTIYKLTHVSCGPWLRPKRRISLYLSTPVSLRADGRSSYLANAVKAVNPAHHYQRQHSFSSALATTIGSSIVFVRWQAGERSL